jgi:hypothetical protein
MIGGERSGRCVQRVRNSFKDDDTRRAALKYLSHLLDFQEGLGCHIYVEKAHYEPNNGFAGKFKSGRRVAMCPGCLGPPGEQSAVDEQKTWSVRICDACKRDGPDDPVTHTKGRHQERGVRLLTPPTTTSSQMFRPPSSSLGL